MFSPLGSFEIPAQIQKFYIILFLNFTTFISLGYSFSKCQQYEFRRLFRVFVFLSPQKIVKFLINKNTFYPTVTISQYITAYCLSVRQFWVLRKCASKRKCVTKGMSTVYLRFSLYKEFGKDQDEKTLSRRTCIFQVGWFNRVVSKCVSVTFWAFVLSILEHDKSGASLVALE